MRELIRLINYVAVCCLISSSAFAQVGSWPPNPGNYLYFGANELGQSVLGNYALLQDKVNGITFLNSPSSIYFRLGNADKMYLAGSGNFGIGTTNPTQKLSVIGGSIKVGDESYPQYVGRSIDLVYGGVATDMALRSDNGSILFAGSGYERMRITNAGNVGIGTTSPSAPLHIKSSGYGSHFTIETNANGQGDLQWFQGGTASANQRAALQINEVTGDFEAWTFNNTVWQKGLLINRLSNNIGIGTSSPTEKLTVNGTIYGKEVKVDLSVPGPDYVFADNYQLLTLNELKTYIDQNKHLPEVPSAKEMEKDGIQLGEMNMLLLKKIEELTLHLINQQKQIEELRETIKQK